MRRTKNFFPALLFCLLLPLPSPVLAAGPGDVPPAGASAAVPGLGDGGNSGGVTDPDDSGSGLDDNAAVPDDSGTALGGNDANPDDSGNGLDDNAADPDGSGGNPGSGMDPAILQTFLGQYQSDSARRATDSGLFRFALTASLALWASKTITQRRSR